MAFKDFPEQEQGVRLLQCALSRGRLAHAYLFAGNELEYLEKLARTLAKALMCRKGAAVGARAHFVGRVGMGERRAAGGVVVDCCDSCPSCLKIDNDTHPDVHWARPESKSRVIQIDKVRSLMSEINLKPGEAEFKVGVVVAADRLNVQAANAFLKTLEEPPEKSVLILLTTDPQRVLETISSRCLRLNFGGHGMRPLPPERAAWLEKFAQNAATGQSSLIGRYRLVGFLLAKLAEIRAAVESDLWARSPLSKYDELDLDPDLRERLEKELEAAIEAEYRRQRAELLGDVQVWMRDVWLAAQAMGRDMMSFPDWNSTSAVASRIEPQNAMENLRVLERLQWLLGTNVQEALALEVSFLKLRL